MSSHWYKHYAFNVNVYIMLLSSFCLHIRPYLAHKLSQAAHIMRLGDIYYLAGDVADWKWFKQAKIYVDVVACSVCPPEKPDIRIFLFIENTERRTEDENSKLSRPTIYCALDCIAIFISLCTDVVWLLFTSINLRKNKIQILHTKQRKQMNEKSLLKIIIPASP